MDPAELPRWPRRPVRLASAVIDDLVDRIVGGGFLEGGTLPREPNLCDSYGVSRSVIREAIKALETMNLVKVQQGQGTTVLPLDHWDLVNPTVLAAVVRHDAELAILDDLVDVRSALEPQMASQAATRATDSDRKRMIDRMAELERYVDDPDRYALADVAFHDAILAASGNRLGRAIISALTTEAYRSIRYIGEPTHEDREISNLAHRAVLDAVVAGDPDLSAQAMNKHIVDSWRRRRPQRTSSRAASG